MLDLTSPVKFDPVWPYPVVVLVSLLVLLIVGLTYPKTIRHLPSRKRRSLITLRITGWALLVLAMLRPSIAHEEKEEQTRVMMIVADNSRSMSIEDGPGGISRRDAILKMLADVDEELAALGQKVEIRYYNFSGELIQVSELGSETPGNTTEIGTTLQQLRDETLEQNSFGVLFFSDGAQRSPEPQDPLEIARQISGEKKFSIYAIPFGGETISESTRDLAIEGIEDFSRDIYEKKTVMIQPRIRIRGAAGQKLTVRLLIEDRTGVPIGETGEMKVPEATSNSQPSRLISTTENDAIVETELSFVPPRTGTMKLAVEVVPIEGEIRKENNRRETIITVRKGGLAVAYFDTYRPEQKFIRNVNSSEQVQLDYHPVRYGGLRTTQIDPALFEPDRYDVYIIGDVPARVFGQENLAKLTARIREGAGLLMTGGGNSFGLGGYAQTPLADYLPVRLVNDKKAQVVEPLKMVPTRRGLYEYVMLIDSREKNRAAWEALAPMAGANLLEPKNDFVQILAESQENQIPLLFATEVGPARVMAFAADTTYQWYLAGQEQQHQRFWQQMMLWLAHKEEDQSQGVWAKVEPSSFSPEKKVPLRFGARNADQEPIAEGDFTIRVRNPEGEITEYQRTKAVADNLLELAEKKIPGDYWVQVSGTKEGQSLGADAWTRFIVDDTDLEMDNPAANKALLDELAGITGGRTLTPEDLGKFLLERLQMIQERTLENLLPLWDNWIFLLLFVGIMSVEWLMRKRSGMV